ncbi:hypothetical protein CYY_004184 [Polysphondylium violaceum]|uniref:alpha-1,2-Mannosidase n=1 Tax=Polysphondylium violaceum TaxID=133409 RepID=A0A8J4Q5W0_9MYCE|nr:hypothetical protein CYY_004184 [Polysphondylium violaceum]
MLDSFKKNVIAIVLISVFIIGTISILMFQNGGLAQGAPPFKDNERDNRGFDEHEDRHRTPTHPRNKRDIDVDDEDYNIDQPTKEPLLPKEGPFNRINGVYEKNKKVNIKRANQVKEAMKFAWDRYSTNVFGYDELRPLSNKPNEWFGLAITIMDSLDTLKIMGLNDEFEQGKQYVKNTLNFEKKDDKVNVFESVIRVLGGLLSTYQLTGDKLFLNKAEEFGKLLLHAFHDKDPLPYGYLNLKTKEGQYLSWTGGCAILSEAGTMFLEFETLSQLTNNPIYKEKVDKILSSFIKYDSRSPGLIPIMLKPDGTKSCSSEISLGAMGDSYYEYLIKTWIYSNKTDNRYRDLYVKAANSIIENLYSEVNGAGLVTNYYEGTSKTSSRGGQQEHLTCFAGGMFALGAAAQVSKDATQNEKYMEVGKKITETCYKSYEMSPTGLGPEKFRVDEKGRVAFGGSPEYKLRPETVESLFVLYRLTGDALYQEWAWNIFQSIEKHCRVENGYVGLHDVSNPNNKEDLQQSFFMAETLKYLYLTFTDASVIPLDQFVFNTEAHPMRIVQTKH